MVLGDWWYRGYLEQYMAVDIRWFAYGHSDSYYDLYSGMWRCLDISLRYGYGDGRQWLHLYRFDVESCDGAFR